MNVSLDSIEDRIIDLEYKDVKRRTAELLGRCRKPTVTSAPRQADRGKLPPELKWSGTLRITADHVVEFGGDEPEVTMPSSSGLSSTRLPNGKWRHEIRSATGGTTVLGANRASWPGWARQIIELEEKADAARMQNGRMVSAVCHEPLTIR